MWSYPCVWGRTGSRVPGHGHSWSSGTPGLHRQRSDAESRRCADKCSPSIDSPLTDTRQVNFLILLGIPTIIGRDTSPYSLWFRQCDPSSFLTTIEEHERGDRPWSLYAPVSETRVDVDQSLSYLDCLYLNKVKSVRATHGCYTGRDRVCYIVWPGVRLHEVLMGSLTICFCLGSQGEDV